MSDMEISTNSGERLSFFQLFERENMQVEIPIIQRDYAQGRQSETEVRNSFLQALYDYLEQGDPFRDLDFVYGSVKVNTNGATRFVPLDGQQRLTTLFLLHWYLAQISRKSESFRQVLTINGISRFTYETRSSSREFCNALVASDIDFSALLKVSGAESLAETIRDRAWFFLSWANDPTIQSMLIMLDAIHEKFVGRQDFYDKLIDRDRPVITFRFLNLAEFNLTDDLYIKMNARGKPLTNFENFKARLEKTIKSFSEEWPKYHLSFKDASVTGYEYFIHKIDTDWADIFWEYRNTATLDDTFDDELMNFIALITANFLLIQDKDSSPALQRKLFEVGKVRQLSFLDYEQHGYLSKPLIVELIRVLDLLAVRKNQKFDFSPHLEDCRYYDKEAVFKKVITNTSSFPEKLRFHAFYTGLGNGKTGEELSSWMRVIFNLTENIIINSVDEYQKALISINELALKNEPIINLLMQDVRIKFFLEVQVFEEKLKAHLLMRSSAWYAAIIKLENHEFFKGQIGFVLKFSGIVDYYIEHGDVNWQELDAHYFEQFKHYAAASSAVFSAISRNSKAINYAWERAVLSKGFYLTRTSADRYNLLSSRANKNNIDRDHSWRRLLRLSLQTSDSWNEKQKYVKEVLDDRDFDPDNLTAGLEKICSNALAVIDEDAVTWSSMLIAKPALFALCNQGFIVKNSHEVVLLYESQRNHYHGEINSKYLELLLKDDGVDCRPFSRMEYHDSKGLESNSILVFNHFEYLAQSYKLQVWYENSFFFFRFSNAKTSLDTLDGCLRSALEGAEFVFTTSDEIFESSCKTAIEAKRKILNLCNQLKMLVSD
jgi:hypothetical protein